MWCKRLVGTASATVATATVTTSKRPCVGMARSPRWHSSANRIVSSHFASTVRREVRLSPTSPAAQANRINVMEISSCASKRMMIRSLSAACTTIASNTIHEGRSTCTVNKRSFATWSIQFLQSSSTPRMSSAAAAAMAAASAGIFLVGTMNEATGCEENSVQQQESFQLPSHNTKRKPSMIPRAITRKGVTDPMTIYAIRAFEIEMTEKEEFEAKGKLVHKNKTDEDVSVNRTTLLTRTLTPFSLLTRQETPVVTKQQQPLSCPMNVVGATVVQATSSATPEVVDLKSGDADMSLSEVRIEEATRKAKQHSGGLKIFSGNGNMALALEICRHLGVNLGKATVGKFADGECNVVIHENVRGKDVYVVQPTCPPVNDNIMELLLIVSTLRRSSARRITVVIPYYGYARQDRKMQARVPISAADIARLMEAIGVDRVIAVDLHCGQIQGFFGPRVPVDNLDGGVVGLDYFGCKDLHNPVVVSPDAGGVYRAKKFKEGLEQKYDMQDLGLAMIVKQRARAGSVDQMDLVGDVRDCDCIIVDDMIDTAGTLVKAADVLVANGARRVFAFASHGLLSGPGSDRIATSKLEEVVILNTIPTSPQREANDKLTQLSVAPLLAQAIFNIHAKKSISALFK